MVINQFLTFLGHSDFSKYLGHGLHTVCKASTIWLCVIWVQQHTHMHRAVTLAFAPWTRVLDCCPCNSQGTQSVGNKSIHNRTTVSRARKDDAAVCPGLQPWRTHRMDGGKHTTQASTHRHTLSRRWGPSPSALGMGPAAFDAFGRQLLHMGSVCLCV